MKIWLLRRRYSATGGAERFTMRLASMLHARGHDVWIAAEKWPESTDGSYHSLRISSSGPPAYDKVCFQRVLGHPDGLVFSLERTRRQHIFRAGDGVHAAWLERRGKYRTGMGRLWDSWSLKHQGILDLERKVFQADATDWIVANSTMVKREILDRFPYPEERIRVIHPGVDLERFQPCADANRRAGLRNGMGLPLDAVVWCFVGSGFERKGLLWAIQIAAAQRNPEVHLVVLGKGARNPYTRAADRLGFEPRVHFIEEKTSALDVYHASDAFILPTIYDPCSNATLEAAACGLAVITTTGNGAAEWTSGIVLDDPSQTQECAKRCAEYARPFDPAKVDQAARVKLDERPCWDAMMTVVENAAKTLA